MILNDRVQDKKSCFDTWVLDNIFYWTMPLIHACSLGSLPDHLWDVPWEGIFEFGVCCSYWILWVSLDWSRCTYPCKYQVKSHSLPWFSAGCAAATAQRNYFLLCTNKINLKISLQKIFLQKGSWWYQIWLCY